MHGNKGLANSLGETNMNKQCETNQISSWLRTPDPVGKDVPTGCSNAYTAHEGNVSPSFSCRCKSSQAEREKVRRSGAVPDLRAEGRWSDAEVGFLLAISRWVFPAFAVRLFFPKWFAGQLSKWTSFPWDIDETTLSLGLFWKFWRSLLVSFASKVHAVDLYFFRLLSRQALPRARECEGWWAEQSSDRHYSETCWSLARWWTGRRSTLVVLQT